MGAGGSKIENLPLVAFCKERKELIKAAADCRYDLATAHILYFQSLLNVGNALNRFVEEELLIVLDPPRLSISHDESSEENSHLAFPSSDSESELGSLTDYVHDDSEVEEGLDPTPLRKRDQPRVNLNVHYIRRASKVTPSKVYEQPQVIAVQEQELSGSFARYSKYESSLPYSQLTYSLHDNLMYAQSNNDAYRPIPISFHPSYPQKGYGVSSGATFYIPQNDYRYPQYGKGDPTSYQYGNEALFRVSTDYFYYNHAKSASPVLSPAPGAPQVSAWDYLNPFSMTDDIYFNYYDHDKYETVSGLNDRDLREVREREGIPDLEDEIDKNSEGEMFEKMKLEGDIGRDSVGGASRASPSNIGEDGKLSEEKENKSSQDNFETQGKEIESSPKTSGEDSKHSSDTFISNNLEGVKGGLGSELDQALNIENQSLGPIQTDGAINLQDAVKKIKLAFETAHIYGKEVSVILEARKLPYQPMGSKLKEFASWIFCLLAGSMVTYSQPPTHILSKRLTSRLVVTAEAHKDNVEDDICRKFGGLSSTLEKLYAWEKKLYKEVMEEEKLRIRYDKECQMLKDLDIRGAESSKIDNAHASIKRLLSKINVAVAAVDVISTRICKLRDEELYPQLTELIEGLIRMWKYVVKCHQKQLQDISNNRNHVRMEIVGVKEESNSKATLNLEMEILSWGMHFCEYVKVQKAFIKFLNEWLLRCLFQEPEETPDGIAPFSPSRVGAPPIFVVCNDWYHAIEKISEIGVSKAILDFASSLHQLRAKQDEEHCQRLKVVYLSKDFDKRLRFLFEERGMQYDQDALLLENASSDGATEHRVPIAAGGVGEDLVLMRKRLAEQKTRHEEAVRKVAKAASGCLEVGLLPIFEALENFCLDNLKACEQIRIPKGGEDV